MLIDKLGEKKGIVSISEALDLASKESLDLVQVSPSDSDPVVCKLLDYGKHLFYDENYFSKISYSMDYKLIYDHL